MMKNSNPNNGLHFGEREGGLEGEKVEWGRRLLTDKKAAKGSDRWPTISPALSSSLLLLSRAVFISSGSPWTERTHQIRTALFVGRRRGRF